MTMAMPSPTAGTMPMGGSASAAYTSGEVGGCGQYVMPMWQNVQAAQIPMQGQMCAYGPGGQPVYYMATPNAQDASQVSWMGQVQHQQNVGQMVYSSGSQGSA